MERITPIYRLVWIKFQDCGEKETSNLIIVFNKDSCPVGFI
jgi:hypothetical protein